MGACAPSRHSDPGLRRSHSVDDDIQIRRNPTVGVLSDDGRRHTHDGVLGRGADTVGAGRAPQIDRGPAWVSSPKSSGPRRTLIAAEDCSDSSTTPRSLTDPGQTPRVPMQSTVRQRSVDEGSADKNPKSMMLLQQARSRHQQQRRQTISFDIAPQHSGVHQQASEYMQRLDSRINATVQRKRLSRNPAPEHPPGSSKGSAKKHKTASVSFGNVQLLEFARASNDATPQPKSGGPGLGMSWSHISDPKQFQLAEFEKMRVSHRTPRERFHREGRISPSDRVRMLDVRN